MALETGNVIGDLNQANPAGGDTRRKGDDHLRLIKKTLVQSFLIDIISNRPAFGTAGRWFTSTDESKLYHDDGTQWLDLTGEPVRAISVIEKSADYTILAGDIEAGLIHYVMVDLTSGDVTITLPAVADYNDTVIRCIVAVASPGNALIVNNSAAAEQYRCYVLGDFYESFSNGTTEYKTGAERTCQLLVARDAAQSMVGNTWDQIEWDTEYIDTVAGHGGGNFTAPHTGRYIAGGAVPAFSVTDGWQLGIGLYVGGVLKRRLQNIDSAKGSGNNIETSGGAMFDMTAGDVLTWHLYYGGSRSTPSSVTEQFYGWLRSID